MRLRRDGGGGLRGPVNTTIRYGVIGGGDMGREHVRNIGLIDGAAVTAVADPYEPSLSAACRLAGRDVLAYSDYRRLLAEAPVDAVVIATPNHTHTDVLGHALGTGKAILVEKPLCTTVEDCRRVETAARRSGSLVWVGMEYRYMPPVTRLVEAVHGGAVGRLRMLHIREHRRPGRLHDPRFRAGRLGPRVPAPAGGRDRRAAGPAGGGQPPRLDLVRAPGVPRGLARRHASGGGPARRPDRRRHGRGRGAVHRRAPAGRDDGARPVSLQAPARRPTSRVVQAGGWSASRALPPARGGVAIRGSEGRGPGSIPGGSPSSRYLITYKAQASRHSRESGNPETFHRSGFPLPRE